MKKYTGFIILAGLVLSFAVAKAEENDRVNGGIPPFRDVLKEKRGDFKDELKTIKINREALKEKIKTERKAFHDKLKIDRGTFKTELKAKKDEWKSANAERKQEFWNRAKDMVGRRFEMVINNLEKVQARVGEVIAKLKAEGKDIAGATEVLDLSKQKLAETKAKLAEIKVLLPATTSEAITPEIFEKIKLLAREAKDLLKESKEYLHQAIKIIKDLRKIIN